MLRRLGLLFAGLVLGLGLAELGARLARPPGNADLLFDSPNATPDGLYMVHEQLQRLPVKNFRDRIRSLGFSAALRTNSLGLRGGEVPPRDGSSQKRWLTLGDSFVIALQVREEDTFQARLQQRTGQLFFNGGVDTYSTWQATGRYRLLAPRLQLDGVILVLFTGNDFVDNVKFPRMKNHLPVFRGDVPGGRRSRTGDLWPKQKVNFLARWLMTHSFLYGRIRVWYRLQALRGGTHHSLPRWRTELALFTTGGKKLLADLMPTTKNALRELRDTTRRRGHKLLVALAPPAFSVDQQRADVTFQMVGHDPATRDLDAPTRALIKALEQLKVEACDLTAALRKANRSGPPTYFTFDGHWTPHGHQVVSRRLEQCLKQRRW